MNDKCVIGILHVCTCTFVDKILINYRRDISKLIRNASLFEFEFNRQ